jgi:hypothetical protein
VDVDDLLQHMAPINSASNTQGPDNVALYAPSGASLRIAPPLTAWQTQYSPSCSALVSSSSASSSPASDACSARSARRTPHNLKSHLSTGHDLPAHSRRRERDRSFSHRLLHCTTITFSGVAKL